MASSIVTSKAVINQEYTLIRNWGKYLLPHKSSLLPLSDDEFLRLTFRRFMRLKPFMSERAMVRENYSGYIRYKYQYEDYSTKRLLVLPHGEQVSTNWKDEVINSFNFILQSVIYVDKRNGDDAHGELSYDILLSKRIMHNILSMEFEKIKDDSKMVWKSTTGKNKVRENTSLIDYKIEFNHLRQDSRFDEGTNKSNKNKLKFIKFKTIGDFDKALIYLNETLNTRL